MSISRKTCICVKCDKFITNNNYIKHTNSCKGPKVKKIRGIDYDPNIGYKLGTRHAWNKGLTKNTDKRLEEYSLRNAGRQKGKQGRPHSDETKEKLSIIACKRLAKHSKYSKNIKYKDAILESTYELDTAIILDSLNVTWEKVRTGFLWNDNGKNRRYIPDFFLPDYNVYLDPKNDYLIKKDKEKIDSAVAINNIIVYIISKEQINEKYISNLLNSLAVDMVVPRAL